MTNFVIDIFIASSSNWYLHPQYDVQTDEANQNKFQKC